MSVAALERVRVCRDIGTIRNGQVSVPRGSTVLFPSNLHVLIAEREVFIN